MKNARSIFTRVVFHENYFFLFCAMVVLLMARPLLHGKLAGVTLQDILFWFVLLSSIRAVARKKMIMYIALILFALSFFCTMAENFLPADGELRNLFTMTAVIADLSLLIVTVVVILHDIFSSGHVTRDKIMGAICVYLLIGVIFTIVFAMLEILQPGSFNIFQIASSEEYRIVVEEKGFSQLLYYSFVTLTTLGYGDIIPTMPASRTYSAIEAIIGQIYLAVLVARLVGLHIRGGERLRG